MLYDFWLFAGFACPAGGLLLMLRSLVSLDTILDEEGNVLGYRRWWRPIVWLTLGLCSPFGIVRLSDWAQPSFNPVPAEEFRSPKACHPPYFDENNPNYLFSSCIDYRYEIDNEHAYDIGLPIGTKEDKWYRVGNDAFLVRCFEACRIVEQRPNVFYRTHHQLQREDRRDYRMTNMMLAKQSPFAS